MNSGAVNTLPAKNKDKEKNVENLDFEKKVLIIKIFQKLKLLVKTNFLI